MDNFLFSYQILISHGSGSTLNSINHILKSFWDDSTNSIKVIDYNGPDDRIGVVRTNGADLGAGGVDFTATNGVRSNPNGGDSTALYSFCSGHDLQIFKFRSYYPYAEKLSQVNHFSCVDAIVCDLAIDSNYKITNATDAITNDGSASFTATSSNGTIKYSLLKDFDYTTQGQGTGLFAGLAIGVYTVYAKDSFGCVDSLNFEIKVPDFYNPLYRLEYTDDIMGLKTRAEIVQRGYTGDVIPVKGGSADPLIIKYNGQGQLNKFAAIIPSQATLYLESETNFYFKDLFSQDDRKYRIDYYKDFGKLITALLSNLSDFANNGDLPLVSWLFPNITTSLHAGQSSKFLTGNLRNTLKDTIYTFDYNIDVTFASAITPLPALSTFTNGGPSGAAWVTGTNPSLNGLTSHVHSSKNLSGAYTFTAGQAYVIYYDFDLTLPSGTPIQIYIGINSSTTTLDDYIIIDVTGTLAGHHSGSVIINATASRSYISLFVDDFNNLFGTVHNYQLTFNSLNFAPSSSDVQIKFILLDRYSNQLSQDTFSAVTTGNHTGTTQLQGAVEPKYISIQAFNPGGNNVTVKVNSFVIEEHEIPVGYELIWTGFVISPNYQEAYVQTPYAVAITATDGLEDLKLYDFLDEFGNKFFDNISILKSITTILNKTDLNLNIQLGVNKFSDLMDIANEITEPFKECYFNPSIFNQDDTLTKCNDVITQLLEPFGARLVQRKGKWIIYCIEESVHEFNIREFDNNGNFISFGTMVDLLSIKQPILSSRASFQGRDQVLEIIPAYGTIDLNYQLIVNPSLIKSYSFEQQDIALHDDILSFKHWGVNIQKANGAQYGIVKTKSFQGDYNFYFKPLSFADLSYGVDTNVMSLLSEPGTIEHDSTDSVEFSFDYAVIVDNDIGGVIYTTGINAYSAVADPSITSYTTGQKFFVQFGKGNTGPSTININGIGTKSVVQKNGLPTASGYILDGLDANIVYDGTKFLIGGRITSINPLWIKLKWMLKVGDYYLNEGLWTNDVNYKYNDLYVDKYNDVQNFKINIPFRQVSSVTNEPLQVEFIMCGAQNVDFSGTKDDYSAIKTITTVDKKIGYKVKGVLNYSTAYGTHGQKVLYWALVDDDGSDDGLAVIRPNDYSTSTNQKVWKLEDQILTSQSTNRDTILNDQPTPENNVSNVYLDNVVVKHLPAGSDPVSSIVTEKTNNKFIKINYSHDFILNDIDTDNINNSERTYENFLMNADGTPTIKWTRSYRTGTDKLLSLLMDDFLGQYKVQSNKLTGSLVFDSETSILTVMREEFDGGKKYMFMGYEMHDKPCAIKFDMSELKDVINDPNSLDAGFSLGFSPGFRS